MSGYNNYNHGTNEYKNEMGPYEGNNEKALATDHVYAAQDDYHVDAGEPQQEETHRSLKPRQISMIAIGGAIGE